MIKADKVSKITEQAYVKKRDILFQLINDKILNAANEGLSYCKIDDSIYFDDTIKHALCEAGYHFRYIETDWGGVYQIRWGDSKC